MYSAVVRRVCNSVHCPPGTTHAYDRIIGCIRCAVLYIPVTVITGVYALIPSPPPPPSGKRQFASMRLLLRLFIYMVLWIPHVSEVIRYLSFSV